jgi:hypothetical protein
MSLNQPLAAEFSTYVHQVLLTASDLSIQTNDRQVSNVVELACDSKARYGRKGSPEGPRSRKPNERYIRLPGPLLPILLVPHRLRQRLHFRFISPIFVKRCTFEPVSKGQIR